MIAKLFNKLFKKTIQIVPNKCEVVIIEDDTIILHEKFGITTERLKQLQNKIDNYLSINNNNKDYTTDKLLVDISKDCRHCNELCAISFLLGLEYAPITRVKTI